MHVHWRDQRHQAQRMAWRYDELYSPMHCGESRSDVINRKTEGSFRCRAPEVGNPDPRFCPRPAPFTESKLLSVEARSIRTSCRRDMISSLMWSTDLYRTWRSAYTVNIQRPSFKHARLTAEAVDSPRYGTMTNRRKNRELRK